MRHFSSVVLTLVMVIVATPVHAATFQQAEFVNVTVPVNDNLYVAGTTIHIEENVSGDLLVAGSNVQIDSTVGNTLQAAGGQVNIEGTVTQSARVAGGTVTISAHIEGDLIVAGGQIFVASGAVIDGDVMIFGGTIVMDAQVGKSLKIYGGDVTLGGSVQGPAEIHAEKATLNGTINGESILAIQNLSLRENASFAENVRYWTKEGETDFAPTLERDATAEFDTTLGPKVNSDTWEQAAVAGGALAVVFGVYSLLSSALILLLFLLLARPLFKRAGDRVRAEPWWSLLIGFLYVAVTPVLILLLFVTLIGIPLALFTLFLYIFSWVFGTVISAMILTRWIETRNRTPWNMWIYFLVSFLIVIGLKLLMIIPILGWIVYIVLLFMAFGGLLPSLSVKAKRSSRS